ncbi:hypothetical protein T11_14224 [Trichinella zimbabwensis]|uniref:Uncharacterized protein n=1 Tax=Trichinella zimbabwensis TaxID=268475 RepID=A0A0V1G727_9BILA|nr:hypothetical protein T11_14224 [Trichinella zimbabwensis]
MWTFTSKVSALLSTNRPLNYSKIILQVIVT